MEELATRRLLRTLVGVAPDASPDQIEAAVLAAHRASSPWAALRHAERASVLMSCADALRSNLEALATPIGKQNR